MQYHDTIFTLAVQKLIDMIPKQVGSEFLLNCSNAKWRILMSVLMAFTSGQYWYGCWLSPTMICWGTQTQEIFIQEPEWGLRMIYIKGSLNILLPHVTKGHIDFNRPVSFWCINPTS